MGLFGNWFSKTKNLFVLVVAAFGFLFPKTICRKQKTAQKQKPKTFYLFI
jgi:hypothetical protein